MGFLFTLLFIAISYLSLPELFPVLIPFRIELVLALLTLAVSVPGILKTRPWRLTQIWVWLALVVAVALSTLIALHWVSGALMVANRMVTTSLVFIFLVANCTSIRRIKIVALLLCAVSLYYVAVGAQAYRKVSADPDGQITAQQIEEEDDAAVVDRRHASNLFIMVQRNDNEDGTSTYLARIRGLSFINDPNDLAQLLITCTVFLFLWRERNARLRTLLFLLLPIAAFMVGVYLTHSRGAVVALAFLLLLVLRKRLGSIGSAIVSAALAAGFIGFGVTGGRAISAQSGADRLELWRSGINILKTNPLFGVGMGNFPDYSPTHHTAHNSFVLCFSELGLTGYFVWLAILIATFAALRWLRLPHTISSPAPLSLAATAGSAYADCSAALPLLTSSQEATSYVSTAEDADTPAEVVRAANVLWYALITFLTAGFFLSRAYSMTLYILLGLAAALQVIVDAQRSSPETRARINPVSLRWLSATTLAIEFASIVAIYLMVRLGGA